MITPTDLRQDFNNAITSFGIPFTLKYWASGVPTYSGTDYDEEYYSAVSGTVVSGIGVLFPVNTAVGNDDYKFIEQGRIRFNDSKLYIAGSLSIDSNAQITYNGSVYDVLPEGIANYEISGTSIYKKIFVRFSTGSAGIY